MCIRVQYQWSFSLCVDTWDSRSEFVNQSKIRHVQWNLATFFNVAIDRPFHGFFNFLYGQVRENLSTSLKRAT